MKAIKKYADGGKRERLERRADRIKSKMEANPSSSQRRLRGLRGRHKDTSTPVPTESHAYKSNRAKGRPPEIGGYQFKPADAGSNKKRLTNVGSSPEFKAALRRRKRNERLSKRLQAVLAKQKKNRRPSTRVTSPKSL